MQDSERDINAAHRTVVDVQQRRATRIAAAATVEGISAARLANMPDDELRLFCHRALDTQVASFAIVALAVDILIAEEGGN